MNEAILFGGRVTAISDAVAFLVSVAWAYVISGLIFRAYKSRLSGFVAAVGSGLALAGLSVLWSFAPLDPWIGDSDKEYVSMVVNLRFAAGFLGGALGFLLSCCRAGSVARASDVQEKTASDSTPQIERSAEQ